MAMRPERLDVLAASVTGLQTVTCIMCFLRVKHWEIAARESRVLSSLTGLEPMGHANPAINSIAGLWSFALRA